ncbi:MAG: hypothetical protein PHR42_04160 [Caldisericia bacterium]|nr:hypothetical protein [Caldisericia bacterium]
MSKQTVINKVEGIITNTTEQDIELPLDLGKGVIGYDAIVAIDYTNAPTVMLIGFKHGLGEYIVYGEAGTIAHKPITTTRRIYVPATFRPFVRVRGGTSGDRVALFVYGYYNDEPYPLLSVRLEG